MSSFGTDPASRSRDRIVNSRSTSFRHDVLTNTVGGGIVVVLSDSLLRLPSAVWWLLTATPLALVLLVATYVAAELREDQLLRSRSTGDLYRARRGAHSVPHRWIDPVLMSVLCCGMLLAPFAIWQTFHDVPDRIIHIVRSWSPEQVPRGTGHPYGEVPHQGVQQ